LYNILNYLKGKTMATSKKTTKNIITKGSTKKIADNTEVKTTKGKKKKEKDIYSRKVKIASQFDTEPILDLGKLVVKAAKDLSVIEARFLRDTYVSMQKVRMGTESRLRSCLQGLDDQPLKVLEWMYSQQRNMEGAIAKCLMEYAKSDPVCIWASSITGIAHTISLHLRGMIDIREAPTPGHLHSFAGLIPPSQLKWGAGQLRPYNADLKKTVLGILGPSFIKNKNNKNDVYGKVYDRHYADIAARNERGEYEQYIKDETERLKANNIKMQANAVLTYPKGRLPDGQIMRRAIRKTIKLFLDHYWEVSYCLTYGKRPKLAPYAIAHQGHAHKIDPPMFDIYQYEVDDVDRMEEYRKYQIEKERLRKEAITEIVKQYGKGKNAVEEVLKKRLARTKVFAERDVKQIAESLAA
jgi:hypothetical protein